MNVLTVVLLLGSLIDITMGGGCEVCKELALFQGTWKVVNGLDPGETFTFDRDRLVNKFGNKVVDQFQIKIIPGKIPKQIDLIPLIAPSKGIACPAIYKIEGNTLTICVNWSVGGKRPNDFICSHANRTLLLEMKKVQAKAKIP